MNYCELILIPESVLCFFSKFNFKSLVVSHGYLL